LEVIIICEENYIDVDGSKVILNIYSMMKGGNKVKKPLANTRKSGEKECQ
jgi:hypothetical protein